MKKNNNVFISLALCICIAGCGGRSYIRPAGKAQGLYHRVRRGDTLWGISKRYSVDIEKIAKANRLRNKRKIYAGQKLFIPNAAKALPPSRKENRKFGWPIKGRIVSFYGTRSDNVKNKGIDIKARRGQKVLASRDGIVSYVDENMKGFGKTIIIDHKDGFSTVYAYNSRILVNVGEQVAKRSVIARAGSSGRAKSPRLHFEIRKNKAPRNPFYYLP